MWSFHLSEECIKRYMLLSEDSVSTHLHWPGIASTGTGPQPEGTETDSSLRKKSKIKCKLYIIIYIYNWFFFRHVTFLLLLRVCVCVCTRHVPSVFWCPVASTSSCQKSALLRCFIGPVDKYVIPCNICRQEFCSEFSRSYFLPVTFTGGSSSFV